MSPIRSREQGRLLGIRQKLASARNGILNYTGSIVHGRFSGRGILMISTPVRIARFLVIQYD
jgi:hypothetical protein